MAEQSRWASRFMFTAILLGLITFGWFAFLLYQNTFFLPISRALAAGSIAVWLLVGFLGLAIATIGTATTALFYHHIEVTMGRRYTGYLNLLAWLHLILMTVAAVVASSMLIWVGYNGGVAMVPAQFGGGGRDALWVHENVAGAFPVPIAIALAIGGLGVFLGGLGYIVSWFFRGGSKRNQP